MKYSELTEEKREAIEYLGNICADCDTQYHPAVNVTIKLETAKGRIR